MLKRVDDDTFRERIGETVHIVAISTDNDDVEDATFRYGPKILKKERIDGRPGCTFTATEGRVVFEALVGFVHPSPSGARYDLFEVDSEGVVDLEESVGGDAADSVISFVINGVAAFASAPELAPLPMPLRDFASAEPAVVPAAPRPSRRSVTPKERTRNSVRKGTSLGKKRAPRSPKGGRK